MMLKQQLLSLFLYITYDTQIRLYRLSIDTKTAVGNHIENVFVRCELLQSNFPILLI